MNETARTTTDMLVCRRCGQRHNRARQALRMIVMGPFVVVCMTIPWLFEDRAAVAALWCGLRCGFPS